jgi:uncharacterized membrane protein
VSSLLDSLAPLASASLRYVPTLLLLWLALFFGRTLRAGEVPLIERIARIGKPELSAALFRYTRRLTAAWCIYFAVAAILTTTANLGFERAGVGVAAFSVLFFVGEYWIRQRLFPREAFPGLAQQLRDTVSVWRPRGP